MSILEEIRLRSDQYQAFGGYRGERHSAEDVPTLLNAVQAALDLADQLEAEATASVNTAKELLRGKPNQGWDMVAAEHEHHAKVARNHATRIREAITTSWEEDR